MDDIQKRLGETAQKTLEAYDHWSQDKSDAKNRESLNEAVHELRKVASRVEIEMAVSERDEQSRNRIPIPPHRSKKPIGNNKNLADAVDKDVQDQGNETGRSNDKPKRASRAPGGSRPRRKASSDNS